MPAASSMSVWIVGVLVLAGGFAAGYLVGGGGGDALPADDEAALLERGTGPASASSPVVTLERPDAPRLESARAAELEPIRRVIRELPPPAIPSGSGVLHGKVLTATGDPLAGVQVTAYPRRESGGSGRGPGEDEVDLATAVQRAVEAARWRHFSRRRATTAGDGTYRIEGLADLSCSLSATLDGWQISANDRLRTSDLRPDAEVDFTAKPVVRVPVTLVMPDGTAPKRAGLRLRQGSVSTWASWNTEEACANLQPGTWTAVASAGRMREYESEPQTVVVEKGKTPSPLRFELRGKGGIKGRVKFAPGEAFKGGRVYVARIPKGEKADASLLGSSDKTAPLRAWGGSAPTFSFPDLPPGNYLVGLGRTYQGTIAVTEEVEVGHEGVEVVLEMPPLEREEYVVVTVVGADGEPVPNPTIRTGFEGKRGSSSGGSTVVDRGDGTMWVLHHAGSAATEAGGTYWVEARHPEYGAQRAEYARGSASTVEIRYGRPGALELTVSGVAGTRYEGRIHAALTGSQGRQGGGGAAALDADGRTTFPGVQPGTYNVMLTLGGHRGRSEVFREEVRIRAGKNTVTLDLPPLHDIVVEGVEKNCWIRAIGKGAGRSSRSLTATNDGRAIVDGLPAGEYEARSGGKRVRFRVPGASTVRFE